MKARPAARGAIRIELEDADDWRMLSRMLLDASDPDFDLADDVSGRMRDAEVVEDWSEFVLPDLRDEFDGAMGRVSTTLERAYEGCLGEPGNILIAQDAAQDWYGVLNRARLALEARYHLAAAVDGKRAMDAEVKAARLRDRLYCALQGLILGHSMG